MSIYQELKGLKVKFLDGETSGDRAIEGEVFYNSAGPNISAHIAVGAWSAGSPTGTVRNQCFAGGGTQTAFEGKLHMMLCTQKQPFSESIVLP